jgi:hypothetical protein
LIGHFLHGEDWFLPEFCSFGWFWSHVVVGGNNEQIRWESVPIRPFGQIEATKSLEGVALRQCDFRQGQYKTKSNKNRCLKS